MRVLSWNVNGLRAAARKKAFLPWLRASEGAIVGLQEVRALPDELPPAVRAPRGWHAAFQPAERKGYSGVALYSRRPADAVHTALGDVALDAEGRLQVARFGALTVVNGYFPNGNGTTLPGGRRTNDRVPFKLAFYRRLFERLEPDRAAGRPVLVMGDLNTAHRPLDLARPRDNQGTSGFLPEEREELDRWLRAGWVDTFRHVHGDVPGAYTWWAQRARCRERNVGWRIDYVLASPGALPFLRDAFIQADVGGSDHCPVGVALDPAVVDA